MSGQLPMRSGAANGVDYPGGGGGPPASQPNTTRTTPDSGLGADDRNGDRNRHVPPGFQRQPPPNYYPPQSMGFQQNPNESMYGTKREPNRLGVHGNIFEQNSQYRGQFSEMNGNQGNVPSRVPPLPRNQHMINNSTYEDSGNQFHGNNNAPMNSGAGLLGGPPLHMMPPHSASYLSYQPPPFDPRLAATGPSVVSPPVGPNFEAEQHQQQHLPTPQHNFHGVAPGNQHIPQGTTYYTSQMPQSGQLPYNQPQALVYEQQPNMYAPDHGMISHQPTMMMAQQPYVQPGNMMLISHQGYHPAYAVHPDQRIMYQQPNLPRNNTVGVQSPHEGYQATMHHMQPQHMRLSQPLMPGQFVMQHGTMQDGMIYTTPYVQYQQPSAPQPLSSYSSHSPMHRGGRYQRGGRFNHFNGNRVQRPYSRQSSTSVSNSENRGPSVENNENDALSEKLQQLDITVTTENNDATLVSPNSVTRSNKDSKQILELSDSRPAYTSTSNTAETPKSNVAKSDVESEVKAKDMEGAVTSSADLQTSKLMSPPAENVAKVECEYCKSQKQDDYDHLFHDGSKVVCQYAKTTLKCKICNNVGGENAHSKFNCPQKKGLDNKKTSVVEPAAKSHASNDVRAAQNTAPSQPRSSHQEGHRGRGRGGFRGRGGPQRDRGGSFSSGRGARRGDK